MWRITEDLDESFNRYYYAVNKRVNKLGLGKIPKEYIRTLFTKWGQRQAEHQETNPSSIGVFPNKPHKEAAKIAESLMLNYNRGRFYPTANFLKYFGIERINTPTMVNSLEGQLQAVKDEMHKNRIEMEKKLAETQMVVMRMAEKMIEEGMFEEDGIYPPIDADKCKKVYELISSNGLGKVIGMN